MTKQKKEEKIQSLRERLQLYKDREKVMLTDGVQSYGVGSRNATTQTSQRSAEQSHHLRTKLTSSAEHRGARRSA